MLSREVWRSEHNQRQFDHWSSLLSHFGVQLDGEQLEGALWTFTSGYARWRTRLLAPLTWLPTQVGFGQSWRMFSNPQTTPSELWVEVDQGHGFEPLYVSRSAEFTWRARVFEHHRVRKLLGRVGRGGKDRAFAQLSKWIARRAFTDHPTAESVRVRTYTWTTPSPSNEAGRKESARKRRGKFTHQWVFRRAEIVRGQIQ